MTPSKDIPKEKHHLIVGGEVHLWTELTDSMTLDFMLWPSCRCGSKRICGEGQERGRRIGRREG